MKREKRERNPVVAIPVTPAEMEAARRWPAPNTGLYEGLRIGFEKGAAWQSERMTLRELERVIHEAFVKYIDIEDGTTDYEIAAKAVFDAFSVKEPDDGTV